jgi:hypothetical protein
MKTTRWVIGILLLWVVMIVLFGCSEQLNGWQIQQAIETCELNGGLDYIIVHEDGDEYLMCMNGHGQYIKSKIN